MCDCRRRDCERDCCSKHKLLTRITTRTRRESRANAIVRRFLAFGGPLFISYSTTLDFYLFGFVSFFIRRTCPRFYVSHFAAFNPFLSYLTVCVCAHVRFELCVHACACTCMRMRARKRIASRTNQRKFAESSSMGIPLIGPTHNYYM